MKQITFSLDDPADVDVSRLPSVKTLDRVRRSANAMPHLIHHPGMQKLMDLNGGNRSHNLLHIMSQRAREIDNPSEMVGPTWTMSEDEYRTHWSEVHDNRIIPYLMLGIPGHTISALHRHTGKVPAPSTAYGITSALRFADIEPHQYWAAADLAAEAVDIASQMDGGFSSPGLPWILDRFQFLVKDFPDWYSDSSEAATVLALALLTAAKVESSVSPQIGPLVRRVKSASDYLGEVRRESLSDDHFVKVITMMTVQSSLQWDDCLGLIDDHLIDLGFQLWRRISLNRRSSKSRSAAVLEVIKMVDQGVPLDWAESAHREALL